MHNCQKAVLMFYAAGLSTKEIAKRFKIGREATERYLTEGQNAVRVFGRANLTRWAIRKGLLPLELCLLTSLLAAGCKTPPAPIVPTEPGPTTPAITTAVVSAAGGTYSVPVKWSPYQPQDATIRIWLGTSPSTFFIVAIRPAWSTNAVVGGLKKNQVYYFKLTAVSTNSLESQPSSIVLYSLKGGAVPVASAPSTAQ